MWANARSWSRTTAHRSIRGIIAAGLALAVFWDGSPAGAAQQPQPTLSAEDQATVDTIEGYLNDLTTVHGRFIQSNADGSYIEGDFFLERPGRMRFEYDDPVPFLLVADGSDFIYVDRKLEQVTYLPLSQTPAYFLLRDEFSFGDGLRLTGFRHEAGLYRLQIIQDDEPDAGSITLTFTDRPLSLRQWTVVDAQGAATRVTLVQPQFGVPLQRDLFRFVNPWRGKNRD